MNDLEAIQALTKGESVRLTYWHSGHFIRIKNGVLVNGFGRSANFPSLEHYPKTEKWEIYKEPTKKKEVWQWRFKNKAGYWAIAPELFTEAEAGLILENKEKHAGPFMVEE